jgi:hypothetical protein
MGGFMTFLVDDGYLPVPVVDPINDDNYRYRYSCNSNGLALLYSNESDDSTVLYSGDFALGDTIGFRDQYFSCRSRPN